MTWNIHLPTGNESHKCKWDIVPYTRGRGLEIGCGEGKVFPHFIGIDNGKDAKLFNATIRTDIIADACELSFFATDSLDFVFSSHTLEHIKDYKKAIKEWWRVIKQEGFLVLYLPHKDFYPRIGEKGANTDHVHDFLPEDIIGVMRAMPQIGNWDLVVCEERDQKDEYSMLLIFKKTLEGHTESWKEPKPEKTCAICRYGAWGDALQMTSVLPGLKEQGYHITVYTTTQGYEVIKHEPLIDKFVLVDPEQVPNLFLHDYWEHLRSKYDKLINFSESVEAQFLALPSKIHFNWPKEARHAVMNHNYSEMTHAIAGVPFTKPLFRFVPTEEERELADRRKQEFEASPLIMWVLAGSSVHKLYPHIDTVLNGILKTYPNSKIITVGDERCKTIIETPWKDPRILRRSGDWGIRETMTMASYCDLVIGPETGVMTSVAMEEVNKIVMLSHSSPENLIRDWVNTIGLYSLTTPCHPCHKMIYTWDHCVRNDNGTAQCMTDIPASQVLESIKIFVPLEEKVA